MCLHAPPQSYGHVQLQLMRPPLPCDTLTLYLYVPSTTDFILSPSILAAATCPFL